MSAADIIIEAAEEARGAEWRRLLRKNHIFSNGEAAVNEGCLKILDISS